MLTVAILNYNGLDTLRSSIESVLAQTLKPDRFIVIDNASTDSSRDIATSYPQVEIVDADNRHKFITGLNTAMSLNQDRLFFMQNDVILDKECLEKMTENCKDLNRFMAQPVIYQVDGNIDNSGMDIRWPGYGERRAYRWWHDYQDQSDCGLVTTICFMTDLKKERFSEVFAPAYYEDVSFKMEYPYVRHFLIHSAECTHLGNHTFSSSYTKMQISSICRRNRKKFIRRHFKGFNQWLRLTVTTCLDIMKQAFDVITNRWIS